MGAAALPEALEVNCTLTELRQPSIAPDTIKRNKELAQVAHAS